MSSYPPPPTRLGAQPSLSSSHSTTTTTAPPLPSRGDLATAEHQDDDGLDVISYWSIGTIVWLSFLAIPLLLFPRLLVFLSQTPPPSSLSVNSSTTHYDDLTPLERYLCTQLGVGIVAVIGMSALLIAPPPPPPFPSLSPSSLPTPLPSSLRLPFLLILSSLLSLSGLISYNTTSLGSGRGFGVMIGLGNGAVGAWGWWVGVFGRGSYRSRKTGADKRTSKFPFYNKAAASVQKEEWKKAQ